MSSVKCQWVLHQLSKPPSEYPLEHEKTAISMHLSQCSECRQLQELAEALNKCTNIEPVAASPFTEKKLINAALDGRMPNQPKINFFQYQWAMKIGIGLAVAAISVVAFLFINIDNAPSKIAVSSKTTANQPKLLSPTSPVLKPSHLITFSDVKRYKRIQDDSVWGTPGTVANVHKSSAKLTQLDLLQGKMVAHVAKRHNGEKFIVKTQQSIVEVIGTIFSVEIDDAGAQHVRVIEGHVKVTDITTGKVHDVIENQSFTLGASAPTDALPQQIATDVALMHPDGNSAAEVAVESKAKSRSHRANQNSAELASTAIREKRLSEASKHIEAAKHSSAQAPNVPDLLARLARAYRQQQNNTAAQETYLRLIREYKGSKAAQNAMVALAQLELNVLDDKQSALTHFNRYLDAAPNGYLAEEAWIGRARAHRALGQNAQLLTTTNKYLSAHAANGSFVAEMLLYRANTQQQRNKCSLAEKDFQTIINRWPNSKTAKQAGNGLAQCNQAQ